MPATASNNRAVLLKSPLVGAMTGFPKATLMRKILSENKWGGIRYTPLLFLFQIDQTPPPWGGGVSGRPLPPYGRNRHPHPGLSRAVSLVLRRKQPPENLCNNARFPFLEWGVSGIPPPHVAFQIDHTPPPMVRGVYRITPCCGRKFLEYWIPGQSVGRDFTTKNI